MVKVKAKALRMHPESHVKRLTAESPFERMEVGTELLIYYYNKPKDVTKARFLCYDPYNKWVGVETYEATKEWVDDVDGGRKKVVRTTVPDRAPGGIDYYSELKYVICLA